MPRAVGGALAGVRVAQVSAGYTHTVVVTAGGWVLTMGHGGGGRLGHGTEQNELLPRRVLGALEGERVVFASATSYTAVVTVSGKLFTFGRNHGGQLGVGDEAEQEHWQLMPREAVGLEGRRVVSAATGYECTVALTSEGEVFTAGNPYLPGVEAHDRFERVAGLEGRRVVQIASGSYHTVLLEAGGRVLTFGGNNFGQLGVPADSAAHAPAELRHELLEGQAAVAVQASPYRTAVVTAPGRVVTFGRGGTADEEAEEDGHEGAVRELPR